MPLPRLDEGRRRTLPPAQIIPPAGYTGFWHDADKHAVVAAVLHGQIVLGQALRDYMLSLEEFAGWLELFRRGPVMSACQVERRVLLGEVQEWLD